MDPFIVQTPFCFHCRQTGFLKVDRNEYMKWKSGALIQDAMPGLLMEEREQLISGTHPKCWDEMMKDEDGDL